MMTNRACGSSPYCNIHTRFGCFADNDGACLAESDGTPRTAYCAFFLHNLHSPGEDV